MQELKNRYMELFHKMEHSKEVEQMPAYFYDLAVEKLTDVDRPHFIRHYFGLG